MSGPSTSLPNSTSDEDSAAQGGGPAAALPVLVITALGSFGTTIVTTGLAFVLKDAYGLGRTGVYWASLALAAGYIAAALLVGPGLRRLIRSRPGLSTRRVLNTVQVLLAISAAGPWVWFAIAEPPPAVVTIAFGTLYYALTGALWPIVETFLTGSLTGRRMASRIGFFNVVWATAGLVTFWAMSPFLGGGPETNAAGEPGFDAGGLGLMAVMGILHLASMPATLWLSREPGPHPEITGPPPTARDRSLLEVVRIGLPFSYFCVATLSPALPGILDRLGLAGETAILGVTFAWDTPAASAWKASRLVLFVVLALWAGWHHRWWSAWAGFGGLLVGFALLALSLVVADRFGIEAGRIAAFGGLSLFGLGCGMIYVAALYYGYEVQRGAVDAGGAHEALIGAGFAAGPIAGLIALWLAGGRDGLFEPIATGVVVAVGVVALVVAAVRARRAGGAEAR